MTMETILEEPESNRDIYDQKIFVSIAAYRDPETIFTINDLITKAKRPSNVYIGVLWQGEDSDTIPHIDQYEKSGNLRIKSIPSSDAKGPCWARYLIQDELYRDEEFYLQIDSHMRFVQDWDDILIQLFLRCDNDNAILTTYPNSYTHENVDYTKVNSTNIIDNAVLDSISNPSILCIDENKKFGTDNMLRLKAKQCKNDSIVGQQNKVLERSLFYAAGFAFSRGHVIKNCPYEAWPDLFFGEEMGMCAKLYMFGYDFYCPDRVICYHLWQRDYRPTLQILDDELSVRKFSQQCVIDILCNGIENSKRTLQDFIDYTGIDYRNKKIDKKSYNGGQAESVFVNQKTQLTTDLIFKIMNMANQKNGSTSTKTCIL